VGCIVMGNVSDKYGRRPVMLCCLAASFCSLSVVARAKTLPQVHGFLAGRMGLRVNQSINQSINH
jgi:MFS family permease